jgi:hypothetical protein
VNGDGDRVRYTIKSNVTTLLFSRPVPTACPRTPCTKHPLPARIRIPSKKLPTMAEQLLDQVRDVVDGQIVSRHIIYIGRKTLLR